MSNLTQSKNKDIIDKATIFRIDLEKISFSYDGMFLLKLTINSSKFIDKGSIRLRSKNSDKFIRDYSVKTEIVGPCVGQNYNLFESGEYSFYLPKGFCRNQTDCDVYLLVEMLEVSSDSKTKTTGSVKIPIYPRTDVVSNFNVEIGDPFYQYRGAADIALHESLPNGAHGAHLVYQSELSEIREIFAKDDDTVDQAPQQQTPAPTDRSTVAQDKKRAKKIIEVSSSSVDKPKKSASKKQVPRQIGRIIEFGMAPLPFVEAPVPPEMLFPPRDVNLKENVYNLLAPENYEEISIFVHGGEQIFGHNRKSAHTYVSCSFKGFGDIDTSVYDSTHVSAVATPAPIWGEILNLSYEPGRLEIIICLTLVDHDCRKKIVEYLLPTRTLTPFLQHHLEIYQKSISGHISSSLYVTIIRKLDHYPLTGKNVTFSAIIVKPLKFLYPRHKNDNIPLICFCYLSNDPIKIRNKINSIQDNIVTVQFPLPSNFDYLNNKKQLMTSSGQISVPTHTIYGVSAFNFPFVFCQQTELETCFTSNSYIIIDFYEASPVSGLDWRFNDPLIRSAVKLDKHLYHQLNGSDEACINLYDVQIIEPFQSEEKIKKLKSKDGRDQKLLIKLHLVNQDVSDNISPEQIIEKISVPLTETQPQQKEDQTKENQKKKEIVEKKKENKVIEKIEDKTIDIKIKDKVTDKRKKEPFLYHINPVKEKPFENYSSQFNLPAETAIDDMISRFLEDGENQADSIKKKQRYSQKVQENYKESIQRMQTELKNLYSQITQMQMENQVLSNGVNQNQYHQYNKAQKNQNLGRPPQKDLFNEYDNLKHVFGLRISSYPDDKTKEENWRKSINRQHIEASSTDIIGKVEAQTKYLNKLARDVIEKEKFIRNLEREMIKKADRATMSPGIYPKEKFVNIKVDVPSPEDQQERNNLYNQLRNAEYQIKSLQNELVEISRKRGANRQMMKIKETENPFL